MMTIVRHVAIVGAGFSGTLLAINLLRHDGPRATLIERAPVAGTGIAYGTTQPDHILNVRASNMSAFPDEPDHFVRWLAARGSAADGGSFVPRATYGTYLRELLDTARAAAPDRLALVRGDVTGVADCPASLRLADGTTIVADAAVLAVGNLAPHVPPGLREVEASPFYQVDPWSRPPADDLGPDDTVLLVGSGLTMVDVALMLGARGFGGRIVALSRRGLLPHRHAPATPNAHPIDERPHETLSGLTRRVRTRASAIGWRNAVDELRPFTQALWRQAPPAERRSFLRHLRPWWDVHRHRLAPVVADTLARSLAEGRLRVAAGKIVAARARADGIVVDWRPRGERAPQTLAARRIVNCTGPQGDLARTSEPLLAALVDRRLIRPDDEHLGIDVDGVGRTLDAEGVPNDALYALGPLTRGAFWEIVAVPDIRRQAWDVARRLANSHWVQGEGL